MTKKMLTLVLVVVFMLSLMFTVALAGRHGGCLNCNKDGCPKGYCYVDCEGCCYETSDGSLACFR